MKIISHQLKFKKPSGTSRGILTTKMSYFPVEMINGELKAIGEVSLIQGLSPDHPAQVSDLLVKLINDSNRTPDHSALQNFPAAYFGNEIYLKSSESNHPFELFVSTFQEGKTGIPINGLIWMGTKNEMYSQIKEKIDQGYRCIKLKIGAIDINEELSLLKHVRSQFDSSEITLRVDANGAFSPMNAMNYLEQLALLKVHSIEQPIMAGQIDEMARLCEASPLPIALDEELIGIKSYREKEDLLKTIKPHFIILKPSLIGGWDHSDEWIQIADSMTIGWWATSALESNVGLNAIAQWLSTKEITIPQGLGTGGLFANNISSPLYIDKGYLYNNPESSWDISVLLKNNHGHFNRR